ncbi:MAG: hypothetical protein AAGK09_02735 [Planctomycetota bacterium]
MHWLDYTIIGLYLASLLTAGVWLSRLAARSADDYFLAGRKLPWWALGASGMSSNLDAAGTMTIIALIYLYGLHGFWIEMRGGVVLPIAVFLAFMGKWHQRSQVVTTGEWMRLRFGHDWQGVAARYTAAATYLVITVGMVVFFLAAAGKFLAVFLPFDEVTCAVAMAVIALVYTLMSGLYGVIWTDVFQAVLIGFAAIYISVLAATYVSPELMEQWPGAAYNQVAPTVAEGIGEPVAIDMGWTFFGPDGEIIDAPEGFDDEAHSITITQFGREYAPFLLFLLFWAGKGILEGLGGSGGSAYMAQRFYAAQDVPTVKKLCMLWTVLFSFRWPMVLGFAILAIHLGIGEQDPEAILPGVLTSDLIPLGIRGLLIAAIFAASMSTFDSTINAGASYVVRDVVNPLIAGQEGEPSQRTQVFTGYIASAGIVAAGLILALMFAGGVLDVWVTIVIQLFPAFLIPFALRWFWGRFNGLGFMLGVVFGFAAAFGLTFLPAPEQLGFTETIGFIGPPDAPAPLAGTTQTIDVPSDFSVFVQNGAFTDIFILGTVGLSSLIGCLVGTFAARDTEEGTKRSFYEQIRPLGWWPKAWKVNDAAEHRGDVGRLVVALVWQVSTFMLPMLLVLRMWGSAAAVGAVFAVTGAVLWRDAWGKKAGAERGEGA